MLPTVDRRPDEAERHANMAFVFGDYFRTMRIPITRGRAFTVADGTVQPAPVVVDETLVKQSFGTADPIGVAIEHGPSGVIVGVAHTVKLAALGEEARIRSSITRNYVPQAGGISNLTAVVRTDTPNGRAHEDGAGDDRRSAISAMPISDVKMLDQRLSDSLGVQRFAMYVLTGFAFVSLLLAFLGVYAVMSYAVSQRNKEDSVSRVALARSAVQIMGMVVQWRIAGSGRGRPGDRRDRVRRCEPSVADPGLRRAGHRSGCPERCRGCARLRGVRGVLVPGAPGHARRSIGGAARGVSSVSRAMRSADRCGSRGGPAASWRRQTRE